MIWIVLLVLATWMVTSSTRNVILCVDMNLVVHQRQGYCLMMWSGLNIVLSAWHIVPWTKGLYSPRTFGGSALTFLVLSRDKTNINLALKYHFWNNNNEPSIFVQVAVLFLLELCNSITIVGNTALDRISSKFGSHPQH